MLLRCAALLQRNTYGCALEEQASQLGGQATHAPPMAAVFSGLRRLLEACSAPGLARREQRGTDTFRARGPMCYVR